MTKIFFKYLLIGFFIMAVVKTIRYFHVIGRLNDVEMILLDVAFLLVILLFLKIKR